MSYTIVGLFSSPAQSGSISKSIESKGFKDTDYIVYTNEKKTSINHISIDAKTENSNKDDLLIFTIAINNDEELNLAKIAFHENGADNITVLDDVSFEEAKNLDYIKKMLDMKAKILIYTMPEFKTYHQEIHTGINSEVK